MGNAHVFPGFLTPVLTQLSFRSHPLLFSHVSAEVRGENTPVRKFASTGYRTHNHEFAFGQMASDVMGKSSGLFRARSDCTYVQSGLALHSPLNISIVVKPRIRNNASPFPTRKYC